MAEGRSNRITRASKHSIVGMLRGKTRFVSHIGLLATEGEEIKLGEQVRVAHMGPPLDSEGVMPFDVVSSIALSVDEIRKIDLWIAEAMEEERPPFQRMRPDKIYIAKPHVEWVCDRITQVRRYRRFSCVGFVSEAYRESLFIKIVTDKEHELPTVPLPLLETVYPGCDRVRIRERLGLVGDAPFRVMLPGYVMNSMHRADDDVRTTPFVPRSGDEEFPPLRPTGELS